MMKSKMCAIIKIICKNIKLGAYCLWKRGKPIIEVQQKGFMATTVSF